jgi:TPR repeat protein
VRKLNSTQNFWLVKRLLAGAAATLCGCVFLEAADANNSLRSAGADALSTNEFTALLRAAEKGDAVAQVTVGKCYARGKVVPYNAVEAAAWYRKAAEQGDAAGQFEFGGCLLSNYGVLRDDAEAFKWIRKSAEQGYGQSFTWLARFYDKAWEGVATNFPEALRWYLRAANSGDDWAQFRLGEMYAAGQGATKDAVEALKWFDLAGRDGSQFVAKARAAASALATTLTEAEVAEARRRRLAADVPLDSQVPVALPPVRTTITANVARSFFPDSAAQMMVEASVELRNNRPIVPVRVNDSKPLRLLFDSGSSMSFLTERAASKLKLKTNASVKVGSQLVGTIGGLTFSLAGASYRPRAVAVHPMKGERILDPFLDGILGADFLQHFVVELDYRAGKVRLRDLFHYKRTGPGDNLLMRFEKNLPYIEATILPQTGTELKGTWLIDTGASGSIYVAKAFADRHSLDARVGKTLSGRSVVFSGTARTHLGQFNNLRLGHYVVERPEVTLEQEETLSVGQLSGAIGGEILRRFTVILHYGRQQVILEPNGLRPKPSLSNESGSELQN